MAVESSTSAPPTLLSKALVPRPAPIAETSSPAFAPYADVFLISFVTLFFELTCIRWFASTVLYLTFFTNIVLMACFLGISVGCLSASRTRNYIQAVIPLALLAVSAALGTQRLFAQLAGKLVVDVGRQPSPQEIFFGTEPMKGDLSSFVIPIEVLAGLFFVLIALMFVGLGQEMGRRFNAIPNRVAAYSWNVFGSLIGIVAFGAASYARTPPMYWFALSAAVCFFFLPRPSITQVVCLVLLLVSVGASSNSGRPWSHVVWSPYYKVDFDAAAGHIETNGIGHQTMVKAPELSSGYALPHLLNLDAGGRPFEDVLVIGAGSGNDVQAALGRGARSIDAVEIEPVMNEIGRARHPDRPYDDPRVQVHLDDGRSFVRKTENTYDLAVYALVDSLVLHSGYSSLRLESFLFTEEAFQDIKQRLKPGGVFAMYNYYRQGWVVARLAKMAEKVFGAKPVVISLPYQDTISTADNQAGFVTFLLVGKTDSKVVESIRRKLEADDYYWVKRDPGVEMSNIHAYGPRPPGFSDPLAAGDEPPGWMKFGLARVDTAGVELTPTDDWPFLYLRAAMIPALNVRGVALIAALSLALLFGFAPVKTVRPNGRMVFLGAGFMLLETKGVVHLALLFGSTWVVNSIVFAAILVMILLANLIVTVLRPKALWPFYTMLFASLMVNTFIPTSELLSLPAAARVVTSCLVVFVPILFAGVIFATSFRDSRQPDVDFGSNIAGVILGGLAEYLSLMLGFNHLILVGVAFYALSAVFPMRPPISASRVAAAGVR